MMSTPTQDILSGIAATASTAGTLISPFGSAAISDTNDSTDSVTAYILDNNVPAGTLDPDAINGSYFATPDGSLIMLAGSAATVQTELRALEFAPTAQMPGTVQGANLTVVLSNTADSISFLRSMTSISIQSTGVNIAIVGLQSATTIADDVLATPFSNAMAVATSNDAVAIRVSMSDSSLGSLETANCPGLGAVVTQNADGSITVSGTAASVSANLQSLGFQPIRGTAGSTSQLVFTIAGTDNTNGTAVTATTGLTIDGTLPAVSLSGVSAVDTVQGGDDVALFSNLAITTLTGGNLTATVATDAAANGTLDPNAMPYGAGYGVAETLSAGGTALTLVGAGVAVQADLQALRLQTVNPSSTALVSNITLTVTTETNETASATERLSIAPSGTAPLLAGNATVETRPGIVALYPTVSVSGPLTAINAMITLSDPSLADFDRTDFILAESGQTGITYSFGDDDSTLEIVGSADAVSRALNQVELTTTTPATARQTSEAATLTLGAFAGTLTASTTILVDGPALTADSMSGFTPAATAEGGTSFAPFALAGIIDPNVGDIVTAAVTDTIAGEFNVTGLTSGSYSVASDGGSVTMTGSAATVQTDLRALALLPVAASSNLGRDETLTVALSNEAGASTVAGTTVVEQLAVSGPQTYWSDTGADNTAREFVVYSNATQTADIDLTGNPNQGIVVFGGDTALDLTAGNAIIVLNGQNQNGAVSVRSLGDNVIWVGAAPVDYVAGGASHFILGDEDNTQSTVTIHGGSSADSNELDIWGQAASTQTVITDGVSANVIFGGVENLAYTGGDAIVVLNGASDTGVATIHSIGENTVWSGTAALDFMEGAGDDTILLTGASSATIQGSNVAASGTTTVLAISNTGIFTYDGGSKAADLHLGGGTNIVHGDAAAQTILMGGGGSLLVSDDGTTTGAQSVTIDQGFCGSMRFVGGANQASLQLGGGNAVVMAGTDTTITGGDGTATIDLSAAVGAMIDLNGSLVGTTDIMGFNPARGSAALTHVATSAIQGGSLVVTFDDGAHATFQGYADPNHAGIGFG